MTDHSDLIERLRAAIDLGDRTGSRGKRPENIYNVADEALTALSSQSLSLSEALERCAGWAVSFAKKCEDHQEALREIERLTKERDEARDPAQALMLDAVAELRRANELAEIVEMFRSRIKQRGEWDDGCFYHNGTSASELQEPLRRAQSALENGKAGLADAPSKSPDPSLSSLRKGAEVMRTAIKSVTDATGAYLPPDGISKDELISRVLAATDNPEINAVMLGGHNGRP